MLQEEWETKYKRAVKPTHLLGRQLKGRLPSAKKECNIPNGVPAHIMSLGAHESHNIGLLFLVHRRVHLHNSLEEVLPDVFPLWHCGDCEKVKYCFDEFGTLITL